MLLSPGGSSRWRLWRNMRSEEPHKAPSFIVKQNTPAEVTPKISQLQHSPELLGPIVAQRYLWSNKIYLAVLATVDLATFPLQQIWNFRGWKSWGRFGENPGSVEWSTFDALSWAHCGDPIPHNTTLPPTHNRLFHWTVFAKQRPIRGEIWAYVNYVWYRQLKFVRNPAVLWSM